MSEHRITITDVMHHMGHPLYTRMFGIHSFYTRIGMIHVVAESNRHVVIPYLFQNEVNHK